MCRKIDNYNSITLCKVFVWLRTKLISLTFWIFVSAWKLPKSPNFPQCSRQILSNETVQYTDLTDWYHILLSFTFYANLAQIKPVSRLVFVRKRVVQPLLACLLFELFSLLRLHDAKSFLNVLSYLRVHRKGSIVFRECQ